jgi:hypothetical protein
MWKSAAGVVAVAALLTLSSSSEAQKKPVPEKAAAQDYGQLRNIKQLTGKLVDMDTARGWLTLRVSIPRLEVNPGYRPPQMSTYRPAYRGSYQRSPYTGMASLMSRYQQIMRNNNAAQRDQQLQQLTVQMQQQSAQAWMQASRTQLQQMQQMMQQLARAGGNSRSGPYRVATSQKDYELPIETRAVVRKLFLPIEYDDEGNLKQFSKSERAALRGSDTSKPGYKASFDELQGGQEVTLYLSPPRRTRPSDLDDPAGSDASRPTVRLIVMTRDLGSSILAGN